jgi:formate-dependent nitrite reductase membrane component NrfD
VAGIMAFGVAIYSGFVVGYVNGIKFWNSAMMPILVVLGGLAAGSAVLLAAGSVAGDSLDSIKVLARGALVFYAIAIFVHLWVSTYSSPSARDSALLLLKGSLAGMFWLAIILVGVVVPLILEFVGLGTTAIVIISAVLVLAGNLTLRYAIIKAGRYNTLI